MDLKALIAQSVHVTPSGGREAARRPFSAPETYRFPTSAFWSVVEPSMSRARLSVKAGVSWLLGD